MLNKINSIFNAKAGLILLFVIGTLAFTNKEYLSEIKAHQTKMNKSFLDKKKTPLSKKQRKKFKKNKGHNFFPINEKFRVVADFKREKQVQEVEMETSTERVVKYDIYGKAIFELNEEEYELTVYQSRTLKEREGYEDYLFLPFTDLTTGESTYGGGRYVDLRIQEGNQMVIDFNKAYSPYCAYSSEYSCTIPPRENFMNIPIEAGLKNIELGK